MIYLTDSNVYVHSFRQVAFGEALRQFHQNNLPRLVLSVIVVHEVLAGATTTAMERLFRRGIAEPFFSS